MKEVKFKEKPKGGNRGVRGKATIDYTSIP